MYLILLRRLLFDCLFVKNSNRIGLYQINLLCCLLTCLSLFSKNSNQIESGLLPSSCLSLSLAPKNQHQIESDQSRLLPSSSCFSISSSSKIQNQIELDVSLALSSSLVSLLQKIEIKSNCCDSLLIYFLPPQYLHNVPASGKKVLSTKHLESFVFLDN